MPLRNIGEESYAVLLAAQSNREMDELRAPRTPLTNADFEIMEWKNNSIYTDPYHPERILMLAEQRLMPQEPELLIKGSMTDWQSHPPKEEDGCIDVSVLPCNGSATGAAPAAPQQNGLQSKQIEQPLPWAGVRSMSETDAVPSSAVIDHKGRAMAVPLTVNETPPGSTLKIPSRSRAKPVVTNRCVVAGPAVSFPPIFYSTGTPCSANLLGSAFGPLSAQLRSNPTSFHPESCHPFRPSFPRHSVPSLSQQQQTPQAPFTAERAALSNTLMPPPTLPIPSDDPIEGAPTSSQQSPQASSEGTRVDSEDSRPDTQQPPSKVVLGNTGRQRLKASLAKLAKVDAKAKEKMWEINQLKLASTSDLIKMAQKVGVEVEYRPVGETEQEGAVRKRKAKVQQEGGEEAEHR
uniref:Uncharacterized protein n=1 Tax=Chromera velia CCMP2878 TaxID=1169474 RepID=A0A0G4HSY1_9ALVE|eukprot:Cvel_1322.t1-p1 / transcript=Cvel_1322.t1 / gene=Cvel_1322 / organism=Chromera_velia_CCMP2878 / gene_product=hypothetical protein / transcript_product=hypothetical protein / location=Cvel_scaffold45:50921-53284(+) / protein_length=405 / sequence_SO=supercontig / SO=protein_coding / is_pseudo=false